MSHINQKDRCIFAAAFYLCLSLFVSGCQYQVDRSDKTPLPMPEISKVVVIGFHPAMSSGDQPGVTRSPITGAVFMAEPVSKNISDKLTEKLFRRLSEAGTYDLVSPGQAMGVFSSLISSGSVLDDVETIKKIGQAFSANAVLTGYAYRWRERQGTDYAVDYPASVAFDLYLVRTDNGGILWKGRFDKTQQALSENLLDMETFFRGKGRWMRAEELADHGLVGLLANLPKGEKAKKD